MTNDERRFRRKSLAAVVIGIVASVALLSLLYIVGTHRCLDKTLGFGQETMVFLKNACEKYDRYEQGRKTEVFDSVQCGDYSTARGAQKLNLYIDEFKKQMMAAGFSIPQ